MDFRRLFATAVENWPAKVLSIGLAIILFVFHRMSVLEMRYFSVPLNVEQLGAMMPSSSYPRMIRISLRGEANSIYSVQEEDIEAFVDMSNYNTPGSYLIPVQWRKRGLAQGLDALQVSVEPMEISFSLDQRISKFVPLVANFRGLIDPGFSMTSYSLDPPQVIIDGPAELMAGINELHTDLIDLNGRNSDFTGTVEILNTDSLIIIRGDGTAVFSGSINRIIPVRNISMVPVSISGLGEDLHAELEHMYVNIYMEGENQDVVERFVPDPDFVRVDCSGIVEPGTYILSVQTGTYQGIFFRSDPDEITIRISQAPREES